MKANPLPFIVCALFSLPAFAAEDLEKLVTPYPGSKVLEGGTKVIDYQEYEVVLSPETNGKYPKTQIVPGRVVKRGWEHPVERSSDEVYRNYEEALKKAGFQPLFTCAEPKCGSNGVTGSPKGIGYFPDGDAHYFAGKLTKADGNVWVSLHVRRRLTDLHFVKEKPMDTGLVAIDATILGSGLASEGHYAVYGILFDTNKADLKPASTPVLAEISKLLAKDAALKLHVVGHTDNVGNKDANLALSKRRAEAIVKELVSKHGVAGARLAADGVGPLAPVASNDAEEGRARNRRVELVKQ